MPETGREGERNGFSIKVWSEQLGPAMKDLPVEIWQNILLDVISVPKLLSVDPIAAHEPPNEDEYWASERTRNALRRVCSSWNQSLSRYNSRYVRTSDVIHGTIFVDQLVHALRIKVDECRCAQCKISHSNFTKLGITFEHVLNHASSVDAPIGQAPWSVEIMYVEPGSPLDVFIPARERLPNLRALYLRTTQYLDDFLSTTLPLSILVGNNWSPSKLRLMDLSKLTTLTLESYSPSSLSKLHFPHLVHVRLQTHWLRPDVSKAVEWLKIHGGSLETFYWIHDGPLSITSPDVESIWSLCPRLERLQLPLETEWTPPPVSHKLQLLRLDYGVASPPLQPCPYCHQEHDVTIQFSSPSPQFLNSGICAVRLTFHSWSRIFAGEATILGSLFCFWMQTEAHAIAVLDAYGLTFEQAVIARLEKWKGVAISTP